MPIQKITDESGLFDKRLIRSLANKVTPRGVPNFDLKIELSFTGFMGEVFVNGTYQYSRVINGRKRYPPLVVLHLCPRFGMRRFPYTWPARKEGYLEYTVWSETEAILFLLAHEIRHLQQHKFPRLKKMGNRRDQYSERDADLYAISWVRRRRTGK